MGVESAVQAPAEISERPRERRGLYDLVWRTGLLNIAAIARRELGAYFVSPMGWVIIALLVIPIVTLFGFLGPVLLEGRATLDNVFTVIQFLMLFAMPAFTMRLLAEERRVGTLEILLTSPLRDWELVLGKWLGVLAFYCIAIAFSLVYVVLLMVLLPARADVHLLGLTVGVGDLDYGTILTSYAGLILLGAMLAAIGLLSSSLTQNQVVAFIVALVVMMLLWYLGFFEALAQAPVSSFIDYVGGANRFDSFLRGQIVLKDVAYFATVTMGALFISARVLESRKWR
jgi:ABC-2 type transport system permease protein